MWCRSDFMNRNGLNHSLSISILSICLIATVFQHTVAYFSLTDFWIEIKSGSSFDPDITFTSTTLRLQRRNIYFNFNLFFLIYFYIFVYFMPCTYIWEHFQPIKTNFGQKAVDLSWVELKTPPSKMTSFFQNLKKY